MMRVVFIVAIILALANGAFAAVKTHEEMVEYVNNGNFGWKAAAHPRFAAQPLDYAAKLCGAHDESAGSKLPVKDVPVAKDIPDSFDARDEWSYCPTISEIRDQSDCGSCWAFATVEAASDRICIQSNGTDNYHLSAQDMNSCERMGSNGCNGGQPSAAWNYLTRNGVVTGGNYGDYSLCKAYSMPICEHHVDGPYPPCGSSEYPTPACTKQCDMNSTYSVPYAADLHTFKSAYSVSSSVEQIQTEIMTNGPVGIAISVYSDFPTYTSGVYSKTPGSTYLGGHAIRMLGWGVDASGEAYWIVANSWNETWGADGYILIKRGVDECGIESSVVAGMYA